MNERYIEYKEALKIIETSVYILIEFQTNNSFQYIKTLLTYRQCIETCCFLKGHYQSKPK